MPTNFNTEDGLDPITIEDTATSVSANRDATVVLDVLVNDGAYDITFTYTRLDGNTQAQTLKPSEICTVPWRFKKLAWVTATSPSAFRCWAHSITVRPGR